MAVAIVVGVLLFMARHHAPATAPNSLQPASAYSNSVTLSNIELSEADNTIGGKSTYIEGHIANHGPATITAITAQVLFANDLGMPPQIETTPLFLIRTREPYIDTEPVSTAPIPSNGEADFRLTFENINANWNTQQPEIRLTQITTR
jgi:hypothetical protein